jgi:hypothetical protein
MKIKVSEYVKVAEAAEILGVSQGSRLFGNRMDALVSSISRTCVNLERCF